jgi:hypothetical protein
MSCAGMYETQEEHNLSNAAKQAAESINAQWQARGEAAIPEIICVFCTENKNFYLQEAAKDRLTAIGLPAIRALLQKRQKPNSDTLCSSCIVSRLSDAIASIYCNSERFQEHTNEWDASIVIMRKLFSENPDEALEIISSVAYLRQRNDCSQSGTLLKEFFPMISTVLRGGEGKARQYSADNRLTALTIIAQIGPFAAPFLPEIIPLLRDTRFDIAAAEALEKIGPQASAAVKELRAAMQRDSVPGKNIHFVKALGAIGPAATEALPDIKRLTARLVDDGCDGKNRQQIEIAVQVMCKLAVSSDDILPRFIRWFSGTANSAIVKVIRHELGKARVCKRMPVSSICESMSFLGKSGAMASGELMDFVRDLHESIWTRGAAAAALEKTGSVAKMSPSDRQLIHEVLEKVRPRPIQQVPGSFESAIPDSVNTYQPR